MKLLIDSADLEEIKRVYKFYPVDGVTTNPSILKKCAAGYKNPFELLKKIREFIGEEGELHVQAVAKDAAGMIQEAERITEVLGKNTYIKIPAVVEGLEAIKALKEDGYNVTATAVYSILQAFLAAQAGADYVAPYVNRIDNLGTDGVETAARIHRIFLINDMDSQVLGASFKNSQQILELIEEGIGALTISPDLFDNLMNNPSIKIAVDDFIDDFEDTFGADKKMSDF